MFVQALSVHSDDIDSLSEGLTLCSQFTTHLKKEKTNVLDITYELAAAGNNISLDFA